IRVSRTSDFAFAAKNRGDSLVPVLIHIKTELAGTTEVESQIGCINFEVVVIIEVPHAGIDRSYRQAKLCDVVLHVEKSETRFRSQTNRRRADLYFSSRIAVDPEIVADG